MTLNPTPKTKKTEASQPSQPRSTDEYPMAVLFTDIVGSTKFFKSHGDLVGRDMLQRHHDMASPTIVEHGGALVKILGDSIMAYFFDCKEALKSAIKIQQELQMYNQRSDPDDHIHIKVGIHFGDGIIEEKDIFGDVVNIAAKLIRLVEGDQIYISREVYDLVQDLSPVRYDLVDVSGKKDAPKGLTLYKVIWDEAIKFDPITRTLLYLKPIWKLGKDNFAEIWNSLLESKDNIWAGKIDKESILSDKSIVLFVKEAPLTLAVAKDVISFLRKNLGQDRVPLLLPIQIIIDSGPYLKADELAMEGLEVNWEEIEPGVIHISAPAYKLLGNEYTFSITPSPETDKHRSFYKLTLIEDQEESKPYLFLYQNALVEGKNPPCYYCGGKKHLTVNCPSKHIPQITQGLAKLGYLSLDTINKLFFNYLAGAAPHPEAEVETGEGNGRSTLWAYHGFYELKEVFQLRFFRTIWNAKSENWQRIKESKDVEDKGGFVWIGQDCLRVSNLLQAESILETSLEKHPQDYKSYCAMGFLNVEKNNFPSADYYFNKALEYAGTTPQRIFLLLLLCRLYDLNDQTHKAEEKIREIIFINPYCSEAIYQNIIFKFREGKEAEALQRLIKLIQQDRDYYLKALIDPDLAPFNEAIHLQLINLFDQAKEEAVRTANQAEGELEKLENLVSEKDKEVEEAQSLWLKVKRLLKADSYFAYVDIIYYSGSIISIGRKSVEDRRRKLLKVLYELNRRFDEYLIFANNYSYQGLISSFYHQLNLIQTKIDQTWEMARSNSSDNLRAAFYRPEEISRDLDQIESKVKNLDTIQKVGLFLARFLKKSLIFQSAILFIGVILFPIIGHYLNLILPKFKIPPIYNIWSYQKTFLIFGGISALLLAILSTIRSFYKK